MDVFLQEYLEQRNADQDTQQSENEDSEYEEYNIEVPKEQNPPKLQIE